MFQGILLRCILMSKKLNSLFASLTALYPTLKSMGFTAISISSITLLRHSRNCLQSLAKFTIVHFYPIIEIDLQLARGEGVEDIAFVVL